MTDGAFASYRALATSVLAQAWRDANKPDMNKKGERLPNCERDEARLFLRGGQMLDFWCRVAGKNADMMSRRACAMYQHTCGGTMQTRGTNPSLYTNTKSKPKPKPKSGKKGY